MQLLELLELKTKGAELMMGGRIRCMLGLPELVIVIMMMIIMIMMSTYSGRPQEGGTLTSHWV